MLFRSEISVTIIATGFAQEQQNEISNTEAKKIIHSLEDDQKIVHNLSDEKYILANQEDNNNQTNARETDEKKEINSEPLIPMNSILYDIEIDAEVLEPFTDQNIDVYDSLTTSSKSSNTKKQESLFEPHFESSYLQ